VTYLRRAAQTWAPRDLLPTTVECGWATTASSSAIRNLRPILYHAWSSRPPPDNAFASHLQQAISHNRFVFGYLINDSSSPSVTLLEMLGVVFSLPNAKQVEDGDFNLDELVNRLTEALIDEFQRNEILQLTGGNAVLVIECLDKVSKIGSRS
jgi:hypothetical protein